MNIEELENMRAEIRTDLEELIEEKESDFDADDILAVIYDEEDNDDYQELVKMIDTGVTELSRDDLDLLTDAWNHFPHKALGGKSPVELREETKLQEKDGTLKIRPIGDGAALISGSLNGLPVMEDDGCDVCLLDRRCREKGRSPTAEEIKVAMDETNKKNKT